MRPLYLRLSTTPACSFRCPYCQPEGPARGCATSLLPREDLLRAVAALTRVGVSRIRLTGGEPLLRRDCVEIVQDAAGLEGVSEVTITTNGERLAARVDGLRQAGLKRVNVHLDTLRSDRFHALTGSNRHADVLSGIRAARDAGLQPVKVNVVLMKGVNDDEILDFCGWAIEEAVTVRFIELMDTGPSRGFVRDHFMAGAEARDLIANRFSITPRFDSRGCGPAREFVLGDNEGIVGFIEPESKPFCDGCNRLRLTHDGRLSTCLYGGAGLPLAGLLRHVGADTTSVQDEIRRFLDRKRSRNPVLAGDNHAPFSMAHIGG